MAKDRMRSVNATLNKELANLITKEVTPFVTGLITVTDLKTSADLRHCNVYISILGADDQRDKIMGILESYSHEFQQLISKRMRMKFTPVFHWHYDTTPEDADRITKLIDEVIDKDEIHE